jgi:hypothetical protein
MAVDKEDLFMQAIGRVESKVDSVQSDVNKFIVIFEKMANMEAKHEEHYKLVHKRITREVEAIHIETSFIKDRLSKLDIVIFFSQHPRLMTIGLAGLYLFTIKDIRDPLLKMIGLL